MARERGLLHRLARRDPGLAGGLSPVEDPPRARAEGRPRRPSHARCADPGHERGRPPASGSSRSRRSRGRSLARAHRPSRGRRLGRRRQRRRLFPSGGPPPRRARGGRRGRAGLRELRGALRQRPPERARAAGHAAPARPRRVVAYGHPRLQRPPRRQRPPPPRRRRCGRRHTVSPSSCTRSTRSSTRSG